MIDQKTTIVILSDKTLPDALPDGIRMAGFEPVLAGGDTGIEHTTISCGHRAAIFIMTDTDPQKTMERAGSFYRQTGIPVLLAAETLPPALGPKPDTAIYGIIVLPGDARQTAAVIHSAMARYASEQTLYTAQTAARMGSWDWDIKEDALFWSPGMFVIFDMARNEAVSVETMRAHVHRDDLKIFEKSMVDYFIGGGPARVEYRIVTPKGVIRKLRSFSKAQYDEAGRILRMTAALLDITEDSFSRPAPAGMVESSLQALAVINSDKIIFANPAFEKLTGYDRETLFSFSRDEWQGLIHPDDRGRILDLFRRQLSQPPAQTYSEFRYVNRSGRIRWVTAESTGIETEEQMAVQIAMTDITERKNIQRQIEDLNQRHETILAAIPDIIVEVDENRKMTWTNRAGFEFFGEDCLGKEAAYYFAGKQDTYQHVKPLFDGEKNVIYVESWQRRKDGKKRLLAWWCRVVKNNGGHVVGALSTARDITEQRQTPLQELAKLLPAAVVEMDMEGRITYINRFAYKAIGYNEKEVLGTSVLDFFVPEDHQRMRTNMAAVLSGKYKGSNEYTIRRKNGLLLPVLAHSAPMTQNGLTSGLRAVLVDISEQKKTEQKLFDSEQKYRALFEAEADTILLVNEQSQTILDVNPAAEKMYGYSRAEFLKLKITALSAESKRSRNELKIKGQKRFPLSYHQKKDGSRFPVELSVSHFPHQDRMMNIFTIRDITDRHQSEQKLRESEQKYRSIFNNSFDGIIYLDPSGKIIDCNEQAVRIYGGKRDDLIGKDFRSLKIFSVKGTPQLLTHMDKILTGKQAGIEVMVKTQKGEEKYLESTAAGLRVGGKMQGVLTVTRDVTERKKHDLWLRRSLEEKEILLKEIHHRVKNNLQIISSLLGLQAGYIEDETTKKIFEDSQERVNSMALVHQLLYQGQDFGRIDLKLYIDELTAHLYSSLGISQQIIRMTVNVSSIHLDLNRAIPCGLLINELVSNCLKHAFPKRQKGRIQISIISRGRKNYVLQVADNGMGIPARIKPAASQSLGLNLVHTLTEQLYGKIRITRAKGTVVEVIFPREIP